MPIGHTIVVSHRSAADFYLHSSGLEPHFPKLCRSNPLSRSISPIFTPKELDHVRDVCHKETLEILVNAPEKRRHCANQVTRVCKALLPPDAFWKFDNELYIASPAYCFVQMAQLLTTTQLIEFGTNLCAAYFIDPKSAELNDRPLLTTAKEIRSFVDSMPSVNNIAKARNAARYIVQNSKSPMETKCYILLACPPRRGGYGIANLVLNHDVDPKQQRLLVEQNSFSVDISDPTKKVGIEYFGDPYHNNVIKDRRRLDGLEALGWKITVVDGYRMYDIDQFEVAARQFAHNLGKRLRRDMPIWREKAHLLRAELGINDFQVPLDAYPEAWA